MDGPNLEHSDSDSGESWTLLDQNPSYAEDAPEFHNTIPEIHNDKDDDTDGISIISDSDHEHISANDNNESEKQSPTLNEKCSEYQQPFVCVNDVCDSNGKVKTYVHRRNKKLSTVLNIIMLGSVITAAGVAIGHTWGARNDCSIQNPVSVNKILSNLYKLEEENAFLRNKVRELTLLNRLEKSQNTHDSIKIKKNRCRKVFEETLNNRNSQKFLKCVDNSTPDLNPQVTPTYKQEFHNDLNALKQVYQQNKSWLDKEIEFRLKQEVNFNKNNTKTNKNLPGKHNESKKSKHRLASSGESRNTHSNQKLETECPEVQDVKIKVLPQNDQFNPLHDALESGQNNKDLKNNNEPDFITLKDPMIKKRNTKEININVDTSETEFKKDDRYIKNKHKNEKKKHDRQKSFKKLKRRNKYEQWEMKGGYLRDYDDISIPSLMDNEYNIKTTDKKNAEYNIKTTDKKFAARVYETSNLLNQVSENLDLEQNLDNNNIKTENNVKEINWYEKRTISRKQARKKLEKQLFGESSPNTSAWYFRRMHRREQCRVKSDNSTCKKNLKRFMNYKMKH